MASQRKWTRSAGLAVLALLGPLAIAAGPAGALGTGPRSAGAAEIRSGAVAGGALTQARVPASEPMKDFEMQPAVATRPEWMLLLRYAKQAGAKVVSTDVSWSSYEPNGPNPPREWANLSAFVNAARHLGLRVRFQLVGYPNWARPAGQPNMSKAYWLGPTGTKALAGWAQFVRKVAKEFARRVSYYEIWNEENISDFWAQGPQPISYARLLETSYLTIKSVDPSATVIFGSLSRNDLGFLEAVCRDLDRLYPRTVRRYHHFFDMLGVHPYSGNRSPAVVTSREVYRDQWGTMDQNFLGFELLHAYLASQHEGWKKIYIGEYGFSTTAQNGDPGVSDAVRAKYLRLAFALAAKTGYVEALSWYSSYATPWNTSNWVLLHGSYPNFKPTLTYKSLESVPDASA